jgi:hypothetical protein
MRGEGQPPCVIEANASEGGGEAGKVKFFLFVPAATHQWYSVAGTSETSTTTSSSASPYLNNLIGTPRLEQKQQL